jgi:iron complex outermembrane receptor protein
MVVGKRQESQGRPACLTQRAFLMSAVAMAGLYGAPALSQTAQPAVDAAAEAQGPQVEDIVVTATRRNSDSQRVPATVQAVSAASLDQLGINSVQKLTAVVPGLQIAPSGGNNLYLRGVGTTSGGYNEAQVAVYVDGLYLANPSMGLYSFNNIDQVEVLKGPQGTLYGRNVTAGLVAITTREPGTKPRMDAEVGYANYSTVSANFYGSLPITDNLAGNVAVFYSKQHDGWGVNTFTGNDISKTRELGIESKLQWRPTPSTTVTGTFIYDSNNRTSGLSWAILPGTIGSDGTPFQGKYNVAARVDSAAPFKAYVGIVKVQQDLGFANLTSISGYQTSHQFVLTPSNTGQLGQPVAGQGATILQLRQKNRTWSQELQLASAPSDSRFDWLLGAFYYNDKTEIGNTSYNTCVGNVCAPGPAPVGITGRPTTKSYSGFADVSYRLFESTKLTGGLRYTDETKQLGGFAFALQGRPNSVPTLPPTFVAFPGQPFAGFPNGIPTKLHFTQLTYRFVLAQDLGQNVHAYASHNLGFKSGAFNANVFSNPPADPELLYATEVGLKSELFSRRLRFNVAYFHYTYKDVQVRSTAPPAVPGTAILSNVGAERINGIDADFSFVPVRGLTINGAAEYLQAKYAKYPGTTCSSLGPQSIVNGALVGSIVTVPCDLSGRRVALSSPFSATLGFTYALETGAGIWTIGANLKHDARRPLTPDAAVYAPRTDLIDASLSWASSDKRFDARIFARNLTNKFTYLNAFVAQGNLTFLPGEPRTYGLTVGFHY